MFVFCIIIRWDNNGELHTLRTGLDVRLSLYYGGLLRRRGMENGRGWDVVLEGGLCEGGLCEEGLTAGGLCGGGLDAGGTYVEGLCEGASSAGLLHMRGAYGGCFLAVLLCSLLLLACSPISDVSSSQVAIGHTDVTDDGRVDAAGDGHTDNTAAGQSGDTASMPSALPGALEPSEYVTFTDWDGKIQTISGSASTASITICNGTDYAKLSRLTGLRDLRLAFHSFSPDDLEPLKTLTRLEVLNVSYEGLTDISALSGLGNLRDLCLIGNQIKDISPLSNLRNLEELRLQSNDIEDLSPLADLRKLSLLCLDCNPVRDITPLSGLGTHTYLTLSGTNLAWDDWEPVKHVVDVSGRPPVENAGAVSCPQNWVKRIQGAYPDGTILTLDYDDYDGDGAYEAFAFVADGKETASRVFEGYMGALVFVTEESMEEVKRETRGQYVSGYYRFEDIKVISLTDLDAFTSSTSYLWTVRDGSPRPMNLSGLGMGFHMDEMGNVCLLRSAYDGSVSYMEMGDGRSEPFVSGHSYKPYYFFYENGDFTEYGAIQVTVDEFLACQGAKEVLGEAETDGFQVDGILFRGNGLIHLNLRRDHEDENGYDSRYQTFRMCPGKMTLIDSDMGTYRESLTDYGQEEKTVKVVYPSGLPAYDR